RHFDVEQYGVGQLGFDVSQRGFSVRCRDDFVALVLQNHPEGVADSGIVVDDEDSRGHYRWLWEFRGEGGWGIWHLHTTELSGGRFPSQKRMRPRERAPKAVFSSPFSVLSSRVRTDD